MKGNRRDETAKGIQSVEIGYEVLACLTRMGGPASLSAIASQMSMSPSKTFFYVTSLLRVGLLRKDETGRYRLGPSTLNLGLAALAQVDPIERAREAMAQMSDFVDQAIYLSVWGSEGPTVVHRMPAPHWQLEIRLGAVLSPLTATGRALMVTFPIASIERNVGKVLRASKPSDPWSGFTLGEAMEICIADRMRMLSRGFGSVFPGTTSLAAPVLDQIGNAVAAITVIGSNDRFDSSYDGPTAEALKAAVASCCVGQPEFMGKIA